MSDGTQCQFRCRVTGAIADKVGGVVEDVRASGSGGDESAVLVRHDLYVRVHAHSQPPCDHVMRTAIPVEAMQEAVHMRSTSHISCRDIIRHVEDKYGISVHRNRFRRNLAAAHTRLHPTESDCNELIAALIEMRHAHSEVHFNVRQTEDGRGHSVM